MSRPAQKPRRPTLRQLLAELERAARRYDRERALALATEIQRRLSEESQRHLEVERRTRELLAAAEPPPALIARRGIDPVIYPVWFGTNRRPLPDGKGFDAMRHPKISRGRVEVLIPESHRFGEVGNPFWKRLLRFDLRDDRLKIQRLTHEDQAEFFADIREAVDLARESGAPPQALVFLHGFNVSFDEAAIRTAQIAYDLKLTGAAAFFSWPSRGSVLAYPPDEATIEASEDAITSFLVDFVRESGAADVHVLAHSMGNRGLLRALQRIAAHPETRGRIKLGQVLLAAPDIDRELFMDLAHLYPEHAARTTLYTSDTDLAVHFSAKLHGAPRAGYFEPHTVAPGIDTVAVPDFDVDLLGHSYFAAAEALLHDMHDLMRYGTPPDRRQRLRPRGDGGGSFWQLQR